MPLDTHHSRIVKQRTKVDKQIFATTVPGLVIQATILPALPFLFRRMPRPMCTSPLSRREYISELLSCGNENRIQRVLGMKLEVFQFLCLELTKRGSLAPSKFISVEEQVAMFLYAIVRSATNRDIQERFQHSGETVSRYFHAVLQALNELVPDYIKLPDENQLPTAIASNSKFYPFFKNCIGALDGTHIAAKVPADQAAAFRNRKGFLSQNVLACCDFDDQIFTYVLAGWEGSAHDGAVLAGAFDVGFKVPTGKYYLGDAGYGLAPYCITLYRGVRYHLREWQQANERYQDRLTKH